MSRKTVDLSSAPLPRLNNIQALRGVAALLVVLSHLWVIEKKYAGDAILGPWADLGMVGVDIFFVISGFIMVYVTHREAISNEHHSKQHTIGSFLYARITRIYPLYWLISAAVLLVFWIAPELVFSNYDQPAKILPSFALWPTARDPLLAVGWTLIHEMGFYLIFAALLFLPKRLFPLGLLLWATLLGLGIKAGLNTTASPALSVLFSPLSFEFLAGCAVGFFFCRYALPAWAAALCLLVGLALWGVTIYLLLTRNGLDGSAVQSSPKISSPMGRTIHFTLPTCLCVLGLAYRHFTLPKALQKIGDWSYALYLSHVLVLSFIGLLWTKFAVPTSRIDNMVFLPILVLISIAAAAIIHIGFERPTLRKTKALQDKIIKPRKA